MKAYTCNTDIGVFEIKQISHERYELWIEYELIGSYECAEFAAEDVATHNTGNLEWDKFENEAHNCPKDLGEWAEIKNEFPQYY